MQGRRTLIMLLALTLAATIAACAADAPAAGVRTLEAAAAGASARDAGIARGIVDSALPIETLLHRFRATTTDTPSVLTGGAESPEALTRALLAALEAGDTSAVRNLAISRAEFAWLYYPHAKWTRPPYEMGPGLVWLQIAASNDKGFVRLVRRYGRSRLRFESLACPDSGAREGPNVVISGCRVRFAAADSASRDLQLFGSLLNRDGRYRFVSYSNDL